MVLGAGGMLGGMVARYCHQANIPFLMMTRDGTAPDGLEGVTAFPFTAGVDSPVELLKQSGATMVLNAVAVLNPMIDSADANSVATAEQVNSLFPHELANAAQSCGARSLFISTDAVFGLGARKRSELDDPDASDIYGRSKRMGEPSGERVSTLRCSVFGPEWVTHRSFLERIRTLMPDATLHGWRDHLYNGVSSLAIARLAAAILAGQFDPPPLMHFIPADVVSKAELTQLLARSFDRDDLSIETVDAPNGSSDRSLQSADPERNLRAWAAAGYEGVPSIEELVVELGRWCS
jgi:dTDP-4-dehydrorhamnose reductase